MAVRDQDNRLSVCERCFATVPEGAEFCEECGAPISDEPSSEGSDGAIYSELARANLLRMRGDYRGAEDVCLSILRRFPNNGTANGLLGDICAERGDLDQAADWYELALDIVPDSPAVRQKLLSVQQRLNDREAAATAQQLGLPTTRPRVALFTLLVIVILVATGVTAYLLGRQNPRTGSSGAGIVQMPVTLQPQTQPPVEGSAEGQQPTGVPQPNFAGTVDEQSLMASLAAKVQDSATLLDLRRDPRTGSVAVSFEPIGDASPRSTAAAVASAVLGLAQDSPAVTVRAVQAGRVVLIADVRRDAVAATTSPEWQSASAGNPDAFANAVLSNEWPSRETSTAAPGGTPALSSTGGAGQ